MNMTTCTQINNETMSSASNSQIETINIIELIKEFQYKFEKLSFDLTQEAVVNLMHDVMRIFGIIETAVNVCKNQQEEIISLKLSNEQLQNKLLIACEECEQIKRDMNFMRQDYNAISQQWIDDYRLLQSENEELKNILQKQTFYVEQVKQKDEMLEEVELLSRLHDVIQQQRGRITRLKTELRQRLIEIAALRQSSETIASKPHNCLCRRRTTRTQQIFHEKHALHSLLVAKDEQIQRLKAIVDRRSSSSSIIEIDIDSGTTSLALEEDKSLCSPCKELLTLCDSTSSLHVISNEEEEDQPVQGPINLEPAEKRRFDFANSAKTNSSGSGGGGGFRSFLNKVFVSPSSNKKPDSQPCASSANSPSPPS